MASLVFAVRWLHLFAWRPLLDILCLTYVAPLCRMPQDAFRKFKGPQGYTTLDFVPTNVQVRVDISCLAAAAVACSQPTRCSGLCRRCGGHGLVLAALTVTLVQCVCLRRQRLSFTSKHTLHTSPLHHFIAILLTNTLRRLCGCRMPRCPSLLCACWTTRQLRSGGA